MKSRKTVRSDSLNSRLTAYSATAVAALAMAPATDAAIQNITTFSISGGPFSATPPSVTGVADNQVTLDFVAGTAHNKSAFNGSLKVMLHSGYPSGRVQISNQAGQIAGTNSLAVKLSLGASVKNQHFTGNPAVLASHHVTSTGARRSIGNFLPPGFGANSGYIGFKTNLHGKTYYGWLKLKITDNSNGYPAQASVLAETGHPGIFGAIGLKGDNITAGAFVVPEPSSLAIGGLGLLALGTRGVREMRRQRNHQTRKPTRA